MEGLAELTRFIYRKSQVLYNSDLIKGFMAKPFKSWQEYYIFIKENPGLEFQLGEFMCVVCLVSVIHQIFPSLNIDVVNKSGLRQIFDDKEIYNLSLGSLRQLRNTNDRQFRELYLKHSKKLHLPLIMTEEMLKQ